MPVAAKVAVLALALAFCQPKGLFPFVNAQGDKASTIG